MPEIIIHGHANLAGAGIEIKLTEPCERGYERNIGTAKRPNFVTSHEFCNCQNTGWKLTADGEKIIDLVRTYAGLANEDHGHSIS